MLCLCLSPHLHKSYNRLKGLPQSRFKGVFLSLAPNEVGNHWIGRASRAYEERLDAAVRSVIHFFFKVTHLVIVSYKPKLGVCNVFKVACIQERIVCNNLVVCLGSVTMTIR